MSILSMVQNMSDFFYFIDVDFNGDQLAERQRQVSVASEFQTLDSLFLKIHFSQNILPSAVVFHTGKQGLFFFDFGS